MAKKQNTNNKTTQPWMIIAIISLAVNVLILIAGIGIYISLSNRVFDGMIVNNGMNKMCSSKFREESITGTGVSEKQKRLFQARLDFSCGNNDSQKYYEQGYNNYIQSLGL
jgi:hypothetical protein